jgi:hypothetical protein
MDLCHPNNPDCVTGVTCADCQAGFNPHFIISGNLISYSNELSIPVGETERQSYYGLQLLPNPAIDRVQLSGNRENAAINATVQVFNVSGLLMKQISWDGNPLMMDVSDFNNGLYVFVIRSGKGTETKKLLIRK